MHRIKFCGSKFVVNICYVIVISLFVAIICSFGMVVRAVTVWKDPRDISVGSNSSNRITRSDSIGRCHKSYHNDSKVGKDSGDSSHNWERKKL